MNQQQLQISDNELSTLPILTASESQQAGEVMDMQALVEEENAEENAVMEQEHAAEAFPLAALLQQEAQARSRETLASLAWGGSFVAVMLWAIQRISMDPDAFVINMKMLCLLMIGMGLLLTVHLARRSYRRKRALTGALAQARDISHIGSLIEATKVENTSVRNLAKRGLIDLLPTLQASDAHLLTEAHRDRLLRVLAISPNDSGYRDLTELFSRSAYQREIDLRLAVLKALEQVGGAKELPAVERLSRGLPCLQSASKVPKEVRDAANECLPYLHARASEQRASEQLLRASSAYATPTDVLLRPARSRADAAPEQLLRPSETM
jgi:hypothetical protein